MEQHIAQLDSKVSEIQIMLGKQQVILDEHIRRTTLLEKQTEEFKKIVYKMDGGLKILFGLLTCIEIASKFMK